MYNTDTMSKDRVTKATTKVTNEIPIIDSTDTCTCTCDSLVSLREILTWVLVVILAVLFTGLLSVVLIMLLQSMKWRATLAMKPLQSNRPLTHTSMKQSEGEGPSEHT